MSLGGAVGGGACLGGAELGRHSGGSCGDLEFETTQTDGDGHLVLDGTRAGGSRILVASEGLVGVGRGHEDCEDDEARHVC